MSGLQSTALIFLNFIFMQVGSLVVCINNTNEMFLNLKNNGESIPELEEIYIVRTYTENQYPGCPAGIRLEEIVNRPKLYRLGKYGPQVMIECEFIAKYFREVQPPTNIYDIFTETKSAGLPKVNTKHPAEHNVANIEQC